MQRENFVTEFGKVPFYGTGWYILDVSSKGIDVDQAKIEVIEKFLPPTLVKAIRYFLRHTDFYKQSSKTILKLLIPCVNFLKKSPLCNFLVI